ncbi:site-specific DNA-methyltransferase [Plantibacter sp. LMC-P-059a]|uniref:site-specific DNA-methyltransferase n=1 Tax=Plantibacter sp. LMC-P-059a TaxID=3040297 RepID=UPI002551C7BF|nr:site-specific DNA-methyltransferase [Plantibacter sp. LMC-P-059a]
MTDDFYETPSTTPNFQTELAAQLADLIPEAIADGKVDVEKLRELLDADAADPSERFGLFWPGKKRALRAAQEPTTATLRPDFENSKDWDTTQNAFIEGDNLEVLKILQKHYHAKIKLIYIDPPYNTGKDFVYPDNYREGLDNYLEWTRQVNEEGKKVTTNSETEGRYHSNWLNMMYPRLKLARNLLRDDGLIFVSINDFEQSRLRSVMDEVFGESNFLASLIWLKGKEGGNDNDGFGRHHEYILCYAKRASEGAKSVRLDAKDTSRHVVALSEPNRVRPGDEVYRDGEQFQLINLSKQKDYTVTIPLSDGDELAWPSYAPQSTIDEYVRVGKLFVGSKGTPYVKSFLADEADGSKPSTVITSDYGTTKAGGIAIRELLGNGKLFSYPKPPSLMKRIVQLATNPDGTDIVLDFFAGSGALAEGVMRANLEDGGRRHWVLVQLPEPVGVDSEAGRAGYATLAELSRERVKRASKALSYSETLLQHDFGFRSYRLADTNFTKWRYSSDVEEDALQQHLLSLRDSATDDATADELLTEVLLKQGYSLTEVVSPAEIDGLDVRLVRDRDGDVAVLAYLNEHVKPTLEQVRALVDEAPTRLILLEDSFQGDDELKTNLAQLAKSKGIELWTA